MSLTIDTHHHMLPDFFYEETNDSHAPVGGLTPLSWSRETSLSYMDEAGIDIAVLSISTPGVHVGDDARAIHLARKCNEFAAELIAQYPTRFGAFASIPLPNVDASLKELTYALDNLKLDGVLLFTNSNGIYLGDPKLEPVFDELERRKAVVYVHSNPSPDPIAHTLGLPDNLIDFTSDTNRAVAQLHYTNHFARTPHVKFIFSHAGGSIPYLAPRFSIIDEMGFIPAAEKRGTAAAMFQRMFWDTALSASAPVLAMLQEVAGPSQIVYGTDFPYFRRDMAVHYRERILNSNRIDVPTKEAIMGGNALKLFRGLHLWFRSLRQRISIVS